MILIAIVALFFIVSLADVSSASDGGNSGGITWEYNEGVLTIVPNPADPNPGQMINYGTSSSVPWDDYRENISSVVIGDGVKNIGSFSFNGIESNYTINALPESVKTIGDNAFMMSKITGTVDLSPVETIGKRAFSGCDSISGKIILKNVTTLDSGSTMTISFAKCGGTGFEVDSSNTKFKSVDGALYDLRTNPNKLVCCPTGVSGTVTVEDAQIVSRAFNSCNHIETIILKGTVTLSNQAFANCGILKSFIFITDTKVAFVNNFITSFNSVKFYVPSNELGAYKAASGWSSHASSFSAINFVTEPTPATGLIYNGEEQTGVSVSYDDFLIIGYIKAVNAGTYEAKITPLAKDGRLWSDTSTAEERTIGWEIGKKPLADCTIDVTSELYYSGLQQTASFDVKIGSIIVSPSEYSVSGNTAVTAGTHTLAVTAAVDGNLSGYAEADWTIERKALDPSMITISGPITFTGKEQTIGFNVAFGTIQVPSEEYVATGQTGIVVGTYTLVITAADVGNYIGSASKDWTINKMIIEVPSELEKNYAYTGEEIAFDIPETEWYKIREPSKTGMDIGKYNFHYLLADETNTAWKSDWDHIFSVYINDAYTEHKNASGKTDVILIQDGGIKEGYRLRIEEKDVGSVKGTDGLGKGTVSYVVDIKLVDMYGNEVETTENLVLRILIPEQIRDKDFDIYHIHGITQKMDYTIDGVYAVVSPDDLSEFVFVVPDKGPSFFFYLLGGILLAIVLTPIVAYAYNPRKKSE